MIFFMSMIQSSLLFLILMHLPSKERVITLRPSSPWYTDDIKAEKVKRRLERVWRKSGLTIDRQLYVNQCKVVQALVSLEMTITQM